MGEIFTVLWGDRALLVFADSGIDIVFCLGVGLITICPCVVGRGIGVTVACGTLTLGAPGRAGFVPGILIGGMELGDAREPAGGGGGNVCKEDSGGVGGCRAIGDWELPFGIAFVVTVCCLEPERLRSWITVVKPTARTSTAAMLAHAGITAADLVGVSGRAITSAPYSSSALAKSNNWRTLR